MSNVKGESDVSPTKPQTTRTDLRKLSSRKLGDPSDIPLIGEGSVGKDAMPSSRHARRWEVRQSRSTYEAGEQSGTSNCCGVCGGKETDQGERLAAAIGPDTEPGDQIAWAVWRTSNDSTGTGRLDPNATRLVNIQGRSPTAKMGTGTADGASSRFRRMR